MKISKISLVFALFAVLASCSHEALQLDGRAPASADESGTDVKKEKPKPKTSPSPSPNPIASVKSKAKPKPKASPSPVPSVTASPSLSPAPAPSITASALPAPVPLPPIPVYTPPVIKPITQTELQSISKAMLAYAKPMIKVMSRDVKVYNWASKGNALTSTSTDMGPADMKDVEAYFSAMKDNFDHLPKDQFDMEGGGVYVAVDPVATYGYGQGSQATKADPVTNQEWMLTQITFPKGMKWLDTLNEPGFPQALNQMITPYCMTYGGSISELFMMAGSSFMGTGSSSSVSKANCKAIRNALVKAAGAEALRYSYTVGNLPGLCPSPRVPQAFVVFSDRALNFSQMESFVYDIPKTDEWADDRAMIQEAFTFQQQVTYPSIPNWTPPPLTPYANFPWPSLVGAQPKESIQSWVKDNWMNCGGNYPEDTPAF